MPRFTEPNYKILKDYFDEILVPRTGTDNSYLTGPKSGIASDGGVYTKLFELDPIQGFIEHKFKIISITGNNFIFEYDGILSTHSLAQTLSVNNQMFFRKDSYFHYWLRLNSADYKDHVNVNKSFIYFGTIYPVSGYDDRYNIIFEGLKDYTLRALPVNNRNTSIEEWLKVFWDESYHPIYNLMKTMWTMIDAKEVNFDFLNYIASDFKVAIDEQILEEQELRDWVQNIAYFLKRKGDYSAYFIIWKLLLGNTANNLNIYERWQEWCSTYIKDVPEEYLQDHHYLEYYGVSPSGGAGDHFYSQYANTTYVTHADTPPAPSACIESTWTCSDKKSYNDFSVLDVSVLSSIYDDRVFVKEFDNSQHDLYLIDAESVPSATDFDYCVTTSMDSSAASASSLMVWALSTEVDVLDNHTNNWLGISHDYGNTEKFTLHENYSGSTYTKSSTGSYNLGTDYFLTIERDTTGAGTSASPSGSLNLHVYTTARRGANDLVETVALNLHSNDAYTQLHGINCQAGPSGGFWSGDVSDLFTTATSVNSVGTSGYMISTPHYRVELDLSSQPLGDTYIIDQDTINELQRYWAYAKPVSKFVDYNYLLAPLANMDENSEVVSTYSSAYNGFLNTVYTGSFYTSASSAGVDDSGVYIANVYNHQQSTFSTEWKVEHNFNSKDIIIQCYDQERLLLNPYDITIDGLNHITVYFNESVRGNAFVALADYLHTEATPQNEWNDTHSFNVSGFSGALLQVWDTAYDKMYSDIVDEVSLDQFDLDFGSYTLQTSAGASGTNYTYNVSAAGYVTNRRASYVHTESTSATTWTINHNMDAIGVVLQVFSAKEYIKPSNVFLNNFDTCTVTFDEAVSGTARLIKFPRNILETEDDLDPTGLGIISSFGAQGYWETGNGFIENYDYRTNNRVINRTSTGGMTNIEEDSNYYYINFTIPTGQELTIKELAIFNKDSNMMFYTSMSQLYKPADISIIVHYRVLKPT